MHLGQADGGETRALVQEAGDGLATVASWPESRSRGLDRGEAAGDFGGDPDGADGSAFLQLYAVERGEGAEIALVLEGEFDGGDLGGSQWVRLAMSRFLTLPSWRKDSRR